MSTKRLMCGISAVILLPVLVPLEQAGSRVLAVDIINENFQGGFDSSIFKPLTGTTIIDLDTSDPLNHKLKVTLVNEFDGVAINIPQDQVGDPSAVCLRMLQFIEPADFPQGYAWEHRIEMDNNLGDTITLQFAATRSFWNRCEYTFIAPDGTGVTTGFLAPVDGAAAKWECPALKDIQFDWLPPDPNNPMGPERIQAEVSAAAAGDCKFLFTKATPLFSHHPGGGEPPAADKYRITRWSVAARGENPNYPLKG